MEKWKIKSRETVFKRKIFSIEDLDCVLEKKNTNHVFTIINTPVWINIVALTENGKFILVKQHRLGTDQITIETPAGLVDSDEDPTEAARRELLEETGYDSGTLKLLKKLKANPAIMDTDIYFYLAENCRKISAQDLDREEDIEICLHSKNEINHMIETGEINHQIIITALLLYFKNEEKNKNI